MIWCEAIVSPEAQTYLWVNPACISLITDWTRQLVWGILTNGNPEKYHTIRWFSDHEKKAIEEWIMTWDMKWIQKFLENYI